MIRRRRRSEDGAVELNVIPLIDVVFFLLVFYVVTTTFAAEQAVGLERPASSRAQAVAGAFVAVAVTKAGAVLVGDRVVDAAGIGGAVAAALRQAGSDRVVVVPDREVPTGQLLQVMDACSAAGAARVDVAARRTGGGG